MTLHPKLVTLALVLAAATVLGLRPAGAQSNPSAVATALAGSNIQTVEQAQQAQQARELCVQQRRRICGKILKILPDGLVINSGYTNLARAQINRSWLIRGSVAAQRATNLIEENQTGAFCVGQVFLTDLPKSPGPKPMLYDYVNLEAFPEGQITYTSVGDVHRTVRKFSARLLNAVQWSLTDADKAHPPPK